MRCPPHPFNDGWLANRSSRRERRLERETGIEPATNSLEGCDSTTELLPPSRFAAFTDSALRAQLPTLWKLSADRPAIPFHFPITGSPPTLAGTCVRASGLAREGLEPSKPLGRQIYSLLRLTASLPRQLSVVGMRCVRHLPAAESQKMELAKGFEPPTC